MNNRFLFRGKCETTGKWFYGSLSQTQSWDYRKEKELVPCIVHETDRGLLIKEVDPATIGQCTGLSASKSYCGERPEDLLIFEGDTVQADWYDYCECAKSVFGEIVYCGNWGQWTIYDNETKTLYEICQQDYYSFIVDIVGNVHDTPKTEE